MSVDLLESSPSPGVYYCQQLTLSVCPSVCPDVCLSVMPLQIDFSFLFLDGIKPLLAVSSPCGTLQNVVLGDFSFRPPNAKNLLPKICTKSPISRLV